MKWLRVIGSVFGIFCFYYVTAFFCRRFFTNSVYLTIGVNLIMTGVFLLIRHFRKECMSGQGLKKGNVIVFSVFFLLLFFSSGCIGTYVYQMFPSESVVSYQNTLYQVPGYVMLLFTLVLAPVMEELFIRDFVYYRLRQISSVIVAASISSLIFAFMHGTTVHAVTGFLGGMFFAFVYEFYGTVWMSVAVHVLYNCLTLFTSHVLYPSFCFQMPFVGILTVCLFFGFISLYCYMDKTKFSLSYKSET